MLILFCFYSLISYDFDVAGLANQYLPSVVVAGGDTGNRNGSLRHHHGSKVSISTCSDNHIAAKLLQRLVNKVTTCCGSCGQGACSIGIGKMHIFQHHEFSAVVVVVLGKIAGELHGLDGIGINLIDATHNLEGLLPDIL